MPNERWSALPLKLGWTRIKRHRHEPITAGGRCEVTFFESVNDGRPHPRLRIGLLAIVDPDPKTDLFTPDVAPANADQFNAAVHSAMKAHRAYLSALDVRSDDTQGRHYRRASVHGQRVRGLLDQARAWLRDHASEWSDEQKSAARYTLAVALDMAFEGDHPFDDVDTGTYHSYQHDAPFVHYLEQLLESLPQAGHSKIQLAALARQRNQVQAHLDALMRHKYARHGVKETDIERSIGGHLVDRRTRGIAIMRLNDGDLIPTATLLRVDPASGHKHSGVYVYRDGHKLRRKGGKRVRVREKYIQVIEVDVEQLTFERQMKEPSLRPGVPFDWDGDGALNAAPIGWVDWAGHCDIKGMIEALGLTLQGTPTLTEYRSETGQEQVWPRSSLLEMLCSMLELGSVYTLMSKDGATLSASEDTIVRGKTRFGGARNDGLPDRLQFQGTSPGRSFRWPVSRQRSAATIRDLHIDGKKADLKSIFRRYNTDTIELSLSENPRWRSRVDGDYNVIDISGGRVVCSVPSHGFHSQTGRLERREQAIDLDLSRAGRVSLGTHLHDASKREVYRCWLDRDNHEIVLELEAWRREDGVYSAHVDDARTLRFPLVQPLVVTASRESLLDDPQVFQTLLAAAVQRGEGIVADTDASAPVWNGVVTHMSTTRVAHDLDKRLEHWTVDIQARFGQARLDYLLRRTADGTPDVYAAVPGVDSTPDFLWQDFPDIGSKGIEDGRWVVNRSMLRRGLVTIDDDEGVGGGVYVHDEHVKNVYEMLWCALSGYRFTIVHGNKRYGFRDRAAWEQAKRSARELRG